MKKTEYFIHQNAYNLWQQSMTQVKNMRNEFIKSNSIEKIIDEDLIITSVAGNQVIYVIKLTYY